MNALILALSFTTGAALAYALRIRRDRAALLERFLDEAHRADRAERERNEWRGEADALKNYAEFLNRLLEEAQGRARRAEGARPS